MKYLFFIIAYAQSMKYYDDFFVSLRKQNYTNTDVLVINEGVDLSIYLPKINASVNEIFSTGQGVGNIVNNRNIALSYAVENGYDAVFSLDIDDTAYDERTTALTESLISSDIYIHDMDIISADNRLLSPSFLGDSICTNFLLEDIIYKNPCGFGNMGMHTKFIKEALPIPNDIVAIDWWLASVALLHGARAVYENKVYSSYRQHDDNFANLQVLDTNQLRTFLLAIEAHYRNLLLRFADMLPNHKEIGLHLNTIQQLLKNPANYEEVLIKHNQSEQPRSKLRGIGLLLRGKPRGIKPVHLRAVAEYKSKLLPPLVAYARIKQPAKRLLWWEDINTIVKENNNVPNNS